MAKTKPAFIYSDQFGEFSYGETHPMRPIRLRLTYDLIKELHLDNPDCTTIIEARQASAEEILTIHSPDYLETLKDANSGVVPDNGAEHGLSYGDNPVFKGVFDWSAYTVGASIQGAEFILKNIEDSPRAFNISGGLHHAMRDKAAGFCYLNDPAIAIEHLTKAGKRVAYIDIDAHHGDGVETLFYDRSDVLTISLHESGKYLFPGTGFTKDMGAGDGLGYSVNLPLPPYTGDDLFVEAFLQVVPPFLNAFKPDVIVTQLGVDSFSTDPITHLNLTTRGFEAMLMEFRGISDSANIGWLALGGGGYDIDNVIRAWTLAWAIISDQKVAQSLHDKPRSQQNPTSAEIKELEGDVEFLIAQVLPLIKSLK